MIKRPTILASLLACSSAVLLSAGMNCSANAGQPAMTNQQQAVPGMISGKVTSVTDASGYTYAEVEADGRKVWAAGPITPLKVGDTVTFSAHMPMPNFHSKSMNRDFDMLYFVDSFSGSQQAPVANSMAAAVPHGKNLPKQAGEPVSGIEKVEGGNTVAEIYADKMGLNGKTLHVRGKVTKFNAKIMGKNWFHLQDSSTTEDLTVTTAETVAVGDVVVVEGKLELDKNFGYGYVYPIILEDARISK